MVDNLVANIQNQASLVYEWAERMGKSAADQAEVSKASLLDAYQAVEQCCWQTQCQLSQNGQVVVDKVGQFVHENRATIFFIGCCGTTAYFTPAFFFSVALITAVVRVEMSRNLKNLAHDYLKDDKNPYILHPYYDNCMSSLDVMMGTIGAVDAIALGTFFITTSWTVSLLPILGGIAAGNCVAKLGMNASNFLAS